jgi:hypothetical protein
MASNDDNNTVLGIMKIGLPAAIFATTGHPEIIEKGDNYKSSVQINKQFLFFCEF